MSYFDQSHASDYYHHQEMKPPMWFEDASVPAESQPSPANLGSFPDYPAVDEMPSYPSSSSLKMKVNYSNQGPVEQTPYARLYPEAAASPALVTRVGRPPKATSTTKMASYARNYRAVKKEQMRQLEDENGELLAENVNLRKHNVSLQEHLQQLEKEILSLRKVLDQDSSIAALFNKMGGSAAFPGTNSGVGVCLHLANGRVSVEVCEQCASRVRARNPQPAPSSQQEDPFLTPPHTDINHPFLV